MKMKVWGIGWMGRSRRIVAETSKKRAAELIGVSLYYFNEYASVTGNEEEVDIALAYPGVVFETEQAYIHPKSWKRI